MTDREIKPEFRFGDAADRWAATVFASRQSYETEYNPIGEIFTDLHVSIENPALVADAFFAALKKQSASPAPAAHLYDQIVAALETFPLQSVGVSKVGAEPHACPFVQFDMTDGRIIVAGDINETWGADVYASQEAFGEGDEHLHTDLSTDGEQDPVTVGYALFAMIQTAAAAQHEEEN